MRCGAFVLAVALCWCLFCCQGIPDEFDFLILVAMFITAALFVFAVCPAGGRVVRGWENIRVVSLDVVEATRRRFSRSQSLATPDRGVWPDRRGIRDRQ